jgi:hypothetical protein
MKSESWSRLRKKRHMRFGQDRGIESMPRGAWIWGDDPGIRSRWGQIAQGA